MDDTEYVTRCQAEHDHPEDDCTHCAVRASTQRCDNCDGEWQAGERAPGDCPTPHHPVDHAHYLRDGFDRELACSMLDVTLGARHAKCGDPVTTAGSDYCDHHQAIADAVATSKVLAEVTR